MFDRCFRCNQPGHTRANCPRKQKQPAAAPATPAAHQSWKPPQPPADRHAYPDDHPMLYACGFCGVGAYSPCVNVGTGKERLPHFTRIDGMVSDARQRPTRQPTQPPQQ